MNHLKYLFGVIVILILSVVSTLYLFPEWLKQREIRAAEADLALLSTPPAPPSFVKNGIDALWRLEYRTTDDAKRAYWAAHPPTGWRRFFPTSMQVPPAPVDDFVAVLLAKRYLINRRGG